MTYHLDDEILALLAEGDLDDHVAAKVAEHLDACPQCRARAEALDPFTSLYALVPEPVPPPDLAAAVLAAAVRPERGSLAEVLLGGGLLAAAAGLMVAFGNPIAAVARVSVVLDVLANLGTKLPMAGPVAVAVVCACVFTLTAVSLTTARLGGPVVERRIP